MHTTCILNTDKNSNIVPSQFSGKHLFLILSGLRFEPRLDQELGPPVFRANCTKNNLAHLEFLFCTKQSNRIF